MAENSAKMCRDAHFCVSLDKRVPGSLLRTITQDGMNSLDAFQDAAHMIMCLVRTVQAISCLAVGAQARRPVVNCDSSKMFDDHV